MKTEDKLDMVLKEVTEIRKDLDEWIQRTEVIEKRTDVLVWIGLTAKFLKWASPIIAAGIAYMMFNESH